MKPIKAFDEFIKQGIVKRHSPDISRAEFLVNESKNTYEALIERVTVMGITNKNATIVSLKLCVQACCAMACMPLEWERMKRR